MFPNLASRFAPESYSPVANCQVSPEQLEEPAKKRTRQHTNGVFFRTQRWKIFTRGHYEKNNPKFMFTTIFGGGIDHRSDRFYAYSTISKLEMTMMGIEYLLIFFRSGFFVDSRMLPLTLAKETFCSNQ